MLCKVIPTAQNACWPIPRSHQLCWGGWEMGTAIWVSANILHVARYIALFCACTDNATVSDLIGLTFWKYIEENRGPVVLVSHPNTVYPYYCHMPPSWCKYTVMS